MENRTQHALEILNSYLSGEYTYLGSGFSGVVFHDGTWVYKIHLPLSTNHYNEIDNILYLRQKLEVFKNRKHFYPLRDLVEVGGHWILVYPYERSEKVVSLNKAEILSFLAEMWKMKIVCKSISMANNFISVNGTLKLIDYEIEPYNDNLFLNVISRAWIQLPDFETAGINYDKLKRSVINQFELPEIHGLYDFGEKVFMQILHNWLTPRIPPETVASTLPAFVYKGGERPSVALLIKSCIQDSNHVRANVLHIVKQLTRHTRYYDIVLLVDLSKESDFLREYNQNGSREELLEEAAWLRSEGVVTKTLVFDNDVSSIEQINRRWFGVESKATHTHDGVPVASQIWAFDRLETDYLLQFDCDAMIGTTSPTTDYLWDKIALMETDSRVVTAGFPIYQGRGVTFQPFVGLNQTMPPDPRAALIHRRRFLDLLPLPNSITGQGLERGWYRSLQKRLEQNDRKAVHGGNCSYFYIHPQNYRKENRKLWWNMIRDVESGNIPDLQAGHVEARGSFFDWAIPKRRESLVVLLILDTLETAVWQSTLASILGQDYGEMGLIVVNNTGSTLHDKTIQEHLVGFPSCTLLSHEQKLASNEALYLSLHYYTSNPDTYICLIREGDLLLSNTVLSEVMNRMRLYDADVLIGNEFSTEALSRNGLSRVNFIQPRTKDAGLNNGLQVFRQQLFASLSVLDFKTQVLANKHLAGYSKIRNSYAWMNDPEFVSILAPIVELARNPIRFDSMNMLRPMRRRFEADQEMVHSHLISTSPKTEGDLVGARKVFLPNLNRIELDITYDCNLKCFGCNRSCTQAPGAESMTLDQVYCFIKESIQIQKQWDLINILGGEPTLHPQFLDIVMAILHDYVIPFSPSTTLQITSNGYGELVRSRLKALPDHPNLIVNTNSFKEDREVPFFTPFNQAPIDFLDYRDEDFGKGCWVTSYCGIGLNHLGYFPCGIAGGIERVNPIQPPITTLLQVDASIAQKLSHYCKLCGNFSDYAPNKGDFMERAEKDQANKKSVSLSWRDIYKDYNNGK